MFDRDTEVARNSAVSFNNEDEAEELALARLEAELRALEMEEEALAREEVEGGMWVTEACEGEMWVTETWDVVRVVQRCGCGVV